jgi:hypothetical protein
MDQVPLEQPMMPQPANQQPAMAPKPKSKFWLYFLIVAALLTGGIIWASSQNKKNTGGTTVTPTPAISVTPTNVNRPTPSSSVSTNTSPTPAVSAVNWNTYNTPGEGSLFFQYPNNWFAKYSNYAYQITNKENCFDQSGILPSGCRVLFVTYAVSGSGTVINQNLETKLKADSSYTASTMDSLSFKINTYWSSTHQDFQALFGDGTYRAYYRNASDVADATTLETAKQILSTMYKQ